jgi:hypothetical protein
MEDYLYFDIHTLKLPHLIKLLLRMQRYIHKEDHYQFKSQVEVSNKILDLYNYLYYTNNN